MYTIRKEFHFEASHQLRGLAPDHPCMRMHGHSYIIILELQSEFLNEDGFVLDYRKLSPVKDWVDLTLDHYHLNDVFSGQPSAELMARKIYELWYRSIPQLVAVEVKETAKTMARYEPTKNKNDE